MFKRTLLVVGMMAALFSVHADLMLYTFDGNFYQETINGAASTIDVDKTYQFLIDFDEAGLEYGSIVDDYTNPLFAGGMQVGFEKFNFGSLAIADGTDFYYENNSASFPDAYARQFESFYYTSHSASSSMALQGNDEYGINSNRIAVGGNNFSFNVGSSATLYEEFLDYDNFTNYLVKGNFTLSSISAYEPPSQSVPEPGSMTLLASGILAISGLSFQRKKHPKK